MNRVFVTQDVTHRTRRDARAPKFDFSAAEQYGRLVTLAPTTRGAFNLKPFVVRLESLLKSFDEGDYLLPIGDPVIVCLAAMHAAKATGGSVKVLKWDKLLKSYHCFQLNLGEHVNDRKESSRSTTGLP